MTNLLLLLGLALSTIARAEAPKANKPIYACVKIFGNPGGMVSTGFQLKKLVASGKLSAGDQQIGEKFLKPQDCDEALKAIDSGQDILCLPASGLLNTYALFELKSNHQIGRSTFEKKDCDKFAAAAKDQKLFCSFSPEMGSSHYSIYSRSQDKSEPSYPVPYDSFNSCMTAAKEFAKPERAIAHTQDSDTPRYPASDAE
ncbi:MAG: hypothetical protein ACXWQO_01945 [Bdellovibrionota bacterium]